MGYYNAYWSIRKRNASMLGVDKAIRDEVILSFVFCLLIPLLIK